ncbi:hypothetical protein GLOIN_2v1674323 [Rhizophagus irregularis DAOM 181602=DAOM 197198]|nr:hypothetical protein GLOIN_2v1674323 [Rhizophagus irregularis DAOM 181602=DAOM 197198]
MSYFPRADDFALAPGYNYTPAGPDDFIFNHDTLQTVPPIDDTLSDTPSFHNDFDDIRPFSSPNKTYIFSTKYKNRCKTFKDFHASRLYNRWTKKKFHQNFSNRLGISFTTSYHAYNTNVVATKGFDFIYGKTYGNLQFTPSSSPKVKKNQEARFNALVRHTFHNAKLDDNALTEDKLQVARHHKLLFHENQSFITPIKHLRYKKRFVVPSKGYYTFPIPFHKPRTVSVPAIVEPICIDSSVASTSSKNSKSPVNTNNWENVPEHYIPLIPPFPIYEGGRLNQPSRLKIQTKQLQPLAVGSDGWLALMKEIYDDYISSTKYEQGKIDAGIQWETTPDQGEYRRDLCDLIMQVTNNKHEYEMKLLEISSSVPPELPIVTGPIKNSERKKREKRHSQKLKEFERKKQEDTEILADLHSRVINEDDIFYMEYYKSDYSLAYQPCAIMDDRPLKRSARDNGNLDTHYSYHIDKKIATTSYYFVRVLYIVHTFSWTLVPIRCKVAPLETSKFQENYFPRRKKIKAYQEYGKHKLSKLETARFHFYFIKVEPSDMLDFDGTEHGTQNSAIFDLGICFLRPALLIFRRLEFCMKNTASNSEET